MRIRSILLALYPVVVLSFPAWPAAAASSAVLDPVQVHAMRGKSTLQWQGRRWILKSDTDIDENQPIQVSEGAALRLRMGRRALLDLGPGSRLVILQLARDGDRQAQVTRLLLEQGYLRIVASDDPHDGAIEVSFGGWSARMGAGEHFFESRGDGEASACSTNGPIAIDGFPAWQPREASAPCVMLWRDRVPIQLSLESHQWEFLRRNRRLHPTLASVAELASTEAVARREQEARQGVASSPFDMDAAQALLDSVPPAAGPEWPSEVPPAEFDRPEWIVNVATYADPERAQQHARGLVEQRFRAVVRPETISRRGAYRVVIEGLPNEAAAQSVVSDLGARYGVRSAWAMRKR